jgi:hypothetical protein
MRGGCAAECVELRSRINPTDPIDAFSGAVTCEDVSENGFVVIRVILNCGGVGKDPDAVVAAADLV